MTGQFRVDIDGLRAAVGELTDAFHELSDLIDGTTSMSVGELTARDTYTRGAVEMFNRRAAGSDDSLQETMKKIREIVKHQIDAYNSTIAEYEKADEHGTVHQRHVDAS